MNSGSVVDDEGSTEFRGVVVAANIDVVDFNDLVGWNVVVGDRGIGIGDEKSAVGRRGNCGIDRNVGGGSMSTTPFRSPLDTGGPIAFPFASKK